MGKLILVTGGARSGKSTFAESMAESFGENILYVATSIAFDEEMKARVDRHRERRPSTWETVEAYKALDEAIGGKDKGMSAVMLDCVTVMVTNLMLETGTDWDSLTREDACRVEEAVDDEIRKLLNAARQSEIPFILVTNETGMGIVPDNAISRLFRDIAGRVNQQLAKDADEVYFCVSGIPMKIK